MPWGIKIRIAIETRKVTKKVELKLTTKMGFMMAEKIYLKSMIIKRVMDILMILIIICEITINEVKGREGKR